MGHPTSGKGVLMAGYAAKTDVTADRSRGEIERTLTRYGATKFGYTWDGETNTALLGFQMRDRTVRFELWMPALEEFRLTPAGRYERTEKQMREAWEQAQRQRWRALLLIIKAKLEAIESGITTFEDEFLAVTVLPSGQTFGSLLGPHLSYRPTTTPEQDQGVAP